MTRTGADHRG